MSTRAKMTTRALNGKTANGSLRPLYETMLETADRLEGYGRLGLERERELNLSVRKLREAARLTSKVCFAGFGPQLARRQLNVTRGSDRATL